MPRIPESLGRVRPTGAQSAYLNAPDLSAADATGRAIQGLGRTIAEVGGVLQERRDRESRIGALEDLSRFQVEQDRVLLDMQRNAPAHSSIDQEYDVQFSARRDELIANAPDDETREYIRQETAPMWTRGMIQAQELEANRNSSSAQRGLDAQYAEAYRIVRTNPEALDAQMERIQDTIAESQGIMTMEEMEVLSRKYQLGLNEASLRGRIDTNPEQVLGELTGDAALSGPSSALVMRESGGNPRAFNEFGYAGMHQMGAPRLAHLGVYKPGSGENLEKWSTTPNDAPGKWSGTFNIPGFPEVQTVRDFLASPGAQIAAFKVHQMKMDEEIETNNFDQYIGQTVGGVLITRQGLRNMIHLGGVGGAKKALTGKGNPRDANGTSVLDYARMGSYDAELSPEQTERLIEMSEAQINENARLTDQAEIRQQRQLDNARDENYNILQGGVARGQVGEEDLLNQVERGNITATQYRTLRDDLRRETDEVGDEDLFNQAKIAMYSGRVADFNEIMQMDALSQDQRSQLIDLWDQVSRRGGPLADERVKNEWRRVEANVVPESGLGAILEGADAARLENARQMYNDLVQNDPQNARQHANQVIDLFRHEPLDATSLPRLPGMPSFREIPTENPQALRTILKQSAQMIHKARETNELSDVEFYHLSKGLRQWRQYLENLPERRPQTNAE